MLSRCMGEWRYSSIILDLSTRWKGVVRFRPRPPYPVIKPRYLFDGRLGDPQSRFGRCGDERDTLPMPRIHPQFHGR
jgi:hypothetical protein